MDADADAAMKAAVKEAIREFLEEKWTSLTSSLGKWVIGLVAAAALAGIVYFIAWANGWRTP
jgi:ABC-type multidrug transport system permease subunit